jgi:uncharacterized protein (DUF2141 family)
MITLMKKRFVILCFIAMAITSAFIVQHQPENKGKLKVVVQGLKNTKGWVGISIYKSSQGFPDEATKALQTYFVEIKNNKAELIITDLNFGSYAVVAYHDENADKKLESNWLGIPKEGVGISNNAKGSMGPPKYNDAKFIFNRVDQTVTFSIVYL